MTPTARAAVNKILAFTAKQSGGQDPAKIFNVAPRIAQTVEDKIRQSNGFLKLVNNIGVKEVKGEILGFGVPATITKRTSTPNAAGSLRRPTDPTGMVKREYECFEVEQDTIISWSKIDAWAHLPNFYDLYRSAVMFAQARDRLMIGWNGQAAAAQTDKDTYTGLQDVNKGWLQYLIDVAPEKVLGLNPDGTVGTIKLDAAAADADFRTLDDLVYHLRYDMLDKEYRKRGDLRVIVGDELVLNENTALLGSPSQNTPTERTATNLMLNAQSFGRTPIAESDEFPQRGVFLSELGNISRYWQTGSVRRRIAEDSHEHKGIVEYNFVRDDYVLEAVEGAACVHPDAIHIKNKAGNWVAAADVWKIA